MPLPSDFHIEVQNGDKPFYPGQMIIGNVILSCLEEIKPCKIYLTLFGRAYVRWTNPSHGGRENYAHAIPSAEETYFSLSVDLWARMNGQEQLHPGTYKWPFSYQLPSASLPASYEYCPVPYEGGHGYIRYWLEAHIDLQIHPRVCYATAQFVFTVLESVDLNLAKEDLTIPCHGEGQRMLCCL